MWWQMAWALEGNHFLLPSCALVHRAATAMNCSDLSWAGYPKKIRNSAYFIAVVQD